jgi:hypothetical protein
MPNIDRHIVPLSNIYYIDQNGIKGVAGALACAAISKGLDILYKVLLKGGVVLDYESFRCLLRKHIG